MSSNSGKKNRIQELISNIQRNRVGGTKNTAQEVVEIIIEIAKKDTGKNPKELVNTISVMGSMLIDADPMAFYIGNIIKRILHTIRTQCLNFGISLGDEKENEFTPSKTDTLKYLMGDTKSATEKEVEIKQEEVDRTEFQAQLLESLNFIEDEIEEAYQSIAEHSQEQIQNNDVILTIGYSQTVLECFKEAAKDVSFSVIVVNNDGEGMSKALAKEGINTTLISDASAFAYMPKISKVIISTRAIMADGGLIADSGVQLVILAADFHTVPVIVISTLYKLTPLYPFDNTTYNTLLSPELVLNSKEHEIREKIDIMVPKYDYIEPDYISLYITNFGCHTPKYIYREFYEYYSKEELN